MTQNEFYYLLLVLGAFGAFAAGLSMAKIQYNAWLRQVGGHGRRAPELQPGFALARVAAARSRQRADGS